MTRNDTTLLADTYYYVIYHCNVSLSRCDCFVCLFCFVECMSYLSVCAWFSLCVLGFVYGPMATNHVKSLPSTCRSYKVRISPHTREGYNIGDLSLNGFLLKSSLRWWSPQSHWRALPNERNACGWRPNYAKSGPLLVTPLIGSHFQELPWDWLHLAQRIGPGKVNQCSQ